MLELTEQVAKDLNEIIAKALEKGKPHSDGFDIIWYKKCRPDFSESYCYHLATLMDYLNEKYKRNWISVQGAHLSISITHSTQYFYEQGGYLKIYQEEKREQLIKELTEKQLQKNIFQLKYWWWILIFSAIVSAMVSALPKLFIH